MSQSLTHLARSVCGRSLHCHSEPGEAPGALPNGTKSKQLRSTEVGAMGPADTDAYGVPVKADPLISRCWASANFDEIVFENPETVKLDLKPNPHVSFGQGIHNCMGAARALDRANSAGQTQRNGLGHDADFADTPARNGSRLCLSAHRITWRRNPRHGLSWPLDLWRGTTISPCRDLQPRRTVALHSGEATS